MVLLAALGDPGTLTPLSWQNRTETEQKAIPSAGFSKLAFLLCITSRTLLPVVGTLLALGTFHQGRRSGLGRAKLQWYRVFFTHPPPQFF